MIEFLTDKEKTKILEEIFLDEASGLREIRVMELQKNNPNLTFREAAEIVKTEEFIRANENKETKANKVSLSEEEKILQKYFSSHSNE